MVCDEADGFGHLRYAVTKGSESCRPSLGGRRGWAKITKDKARVDSSRSKMNNTRANNLILMNEAGNPFYSKKNISSLAWHEMRDLGFKRNSRQD
jgi:hypothetical protein